jgi:tetratricopeptide (TPR) repeat protein
MTMITMIVREQKKLCALLLIFAANTLSYSQSEKEIVSKYRSALHKLADEKSIQSMELKGTFRTQKLNFPAAIYYRAPNLRIEMAFQSLTFLQISNDSIRWEYNPMEEKNTITPITKTTGDWTNGNSSFDFINYDLLNYQELKHKLKLTGREKVDSLEVYVLELSRPDKTKTKFLLDAKSGLIYKVEDSRGYRYFANYSNNNGYVFPRYVLESGNNREMEARFNQLTFNLSLPDSLFLIPERAFANKAKLIVPTNNFTTSGDSLYANGEYERAVEYYTKVIKFNDLDGYAYNARGLARIELKEYYEAIADFNKALEINPNSANPRNNLGLAKYYLGDHAGALKDYSKAIELDSKLLVAYKNRGIIYLEKDKNELAVADFSSAVKLDPTDGQAHFRLGVAFAELEKYEDALQSYAAARGNKYNGADLYNYIGVTEYRLERYDSASVSFKKALNLEPDHLQYIENYGRALYEVGRYTEASVQFETYLKKQNENASIHNLLGLCKYQDENYHAAIQDFSKSIKLNDKEATYYDNRASAKEMLEDYEGAIKDYSESIRLYPNDPSVFYRRGLVKIHTSKKLEGCLDLATANEMKYEPANEAIMKNCH